MAHKVEIKTTHYTPKRYSIPWIARVDFSKSDKGEFVWGNWIGDASIGSDGLLVVDVEDRDIVATGQKDSKGKQTTVDYYQVVGKDLVHLAGKLEAYELVRKQQACPESADNYGQVYAQPDVAILDPVDRNRYLKMLKRSGLLDRLTVDLCVAIITLLHESYQHGKESVMAENPSVAAAALGSIKTEKKSLTSAENGKKGGRPPAK